MQVPVEYQTSEVLLWTSNDWADLLRLSRQRVHQFIQEGRLTPQRVTMRGYVLFEPDYVEWAKENVPIVKKRISEIGLE